MMENGVHKIIAKVVFQPTEYSMRCQMDLFWSQTASPLVDCLFWFTEWIVHRLSHGAQWHSIKKIFNSRFSLNLLTL